MSQDSPSGTSAPPPSGSPWGLLATLTALNVLSYVDRQLLMTLAPLLIEDLGLTNAQIGLLMGASFIVVFAGLTLLLGVAADRFSRTKLIAAGLGVWSVATALTAGARGFAHLAILRVFVGVGEATLSPAGLSMLGDRFPAHRRGLANSIFYTGIPVGTAISFLLSAQIGPRYGWQACFLVLGVAGLLAVGGVLLMTDPPRRGAKAVPSKGSASRWVISLGEAVSQRPAIALVSLAGALLGFMSSAAQHTITWLVEERGFEYTRAAYLSAGMVAVGGLLGNVVVGVVTDWGRRLHPRGRLWSFAGLVALALPVGAVFYTIAPSSVLFVPSWFLAQAWFMGWFGPLFAALDELAPSGQRATVLGFGLLVTYVLGVAPGSWIAGLIADRIHLTAGLLTGVGVGALALVPLALATRTSRSSSESEFVEVYPPEDGEA